MRIDFNRMGVRSFVITALIAGLGFFVLKGRRPKEIKGLALNPVVDETGYSPGRILIVPIGGSGDVGLYNKKGYFEKILPTNIRKIYRSCLIPVFTGTRFPGLF